MTLVTFALNPSHQRGPCPSEFALEKPACEDVISWGIGAGALVLHDDSLKATTCTHENGLPK